MMKKNFFENKIKPLLLYVGFIGSIVMTLAYIILIIVLIFGFKAKLDMKQIITYAIINACFGLVIMFLLKYQGKDFAKNLDENKELVKEYYQNKTKDKKILSMKYFWIKSTITDVCTKILFVIVSTTLLLTIIIKGSNDLALLGIAVTNILMFVCFGFLSLVKAYDFFNEYHVPYMKEELKKVGIELKEQPKNDIIIEGEEKDETL